MRVAINELEVIPQQEQPASSPQQERGGGPGAKTKVSAHDVRRMERHVHVRSLRTWAH